MQSFTDAKRLISNKFEAIFENSQLRLSQWNEKETKHMTKPPLGDFHFFENESIESLMENANMSVIQDDLYKEAEGILESLINQENGSPFENFVANEHVAPPPPLLNNQHQSGFQM